MSLVPTKSDVEALVGTSSPTKISHIRCKGECERVLPLTDYKVIRAKRYLKDGKEVIYTHYYTKCNQCLYADSKEKKRRKDNGLAHRGEDNGRAKLTEDWIRFIRSPTGRRIKATVIAEWAEVSVDAVSKARCMKTWKHIPDMGK